MIAMSVAYSLKKRTSKTGFFFSPYAENIPCENFSGGHVFCKYGFHFSSFKLVNNF